MIKFFQTKSFKDLDREWRDRLARSGFADAEEIKNGERVLKHYVVMSRKVFDDYREEYYRTLSAHIHETIFASALDQWIMCLHACGWKIKDIVSYLKDQNVSIHRQTVRFVIRRHEHQWGLRKWDLKQRNLKNG